MENHHVRQIIIFEFLNMAMFKFANLFFFIREVPVCWLSSAAAQGFAKSKDPLAAKNLYREMRSERVPFPGSQQRSLGAGGWGRCHVVIFKATTLPSGNLT